MARAFNEPNKIEDDFRQAEAQLGLTQAMENALGLETDPEELEKI